MNLPLSKRKEKGDKLKGICLRTLLTVSAKRQNYKEGKMLHLSAGRLALLVTLVLSLAIGISFVPDFTHADVAPPGPRPRPSPRPVPPPPPNVQSNPYAGHGGAIGLNYFSLGLNTGELFVVAGCLLVGLEAVFLVGLIRTRKRKLDE